MTPYGFLDTPPVVTAPPERKLCLRHWKARKRDLIGQINI